MRLLLVEDNPVDVHLLREAFRELNSAASLRVASTGDECLALLHGVSPLSPAEYPDLIFLDLHLPTMSGYEVLRALKGDPRTRHIPIIVLSSSQTDEEVAQAYRGYANAYVRKPGNIADLMTAARGLKSFWMETARLASNLAGR